ncbi:hypothetical protein HB780_04385 (plasmid) [Rhizobium lusitanum]|uniref:hypothetical protein n=1 Tax=Rhizobium lusitanum TaxID=293958 RepID=UPI001615D6CB|nr:hypothetical protein [Rhizobium lusitanum]QND45008.1 hypothetical protein HB780_04385 [Rhizobium lusitanum]
MTEPVETAMSAERFAALAAAYGGVIDRWPEGERASAEIFAKAPAGASALAAASDLDHLLDAYALKARNDGLGDRILTRLTRRSRMRKWFRFSSAGLGLVGVGIAGALAGSIAIAVLAPNVTSDTTVATDRTATVFGDIGTDENATQDTQ